MSAELVTRALNVSCGGSAGEKLVLVILAHHANHQSGKCFPSVATIAREAEYKKPDMVYRHLNSLEAKGHITRLSGGGRKKGGSSGNSNRYLVHPQADSGKIVTRDEVRDRRQLASDQMLDGADPEGLCETINPPPERRVLESDGLFRPSNPPPERRVDSILRDENPPREERVQASDTLHSNRDNPPPQGFETLHRSGDEQETTGMNRTGIPQNSAMVELAMSPAETFPFESSEFRAAWNAWYLHRKDLRKPITPTSRSLQFKRMKEWGESRSVAAIYHSIEHGWTGIFEPKQTSVIIQPKRSNPSHTII